MRRLAILAGLTTAYAAAATTAVAEGVEAGGTARVEALSPRIEALRSVVRDQVSRIEVTESAEGRAFAVPTDVLFEFDSARVSPTGAAALRRLGPDLRNGPVTIVGHTDARGDDDYNDRLSRRRAEAVATVLRGVTSGIRFDVRGAGEREPVASNRNEAGRRRNRRVEIQVPRG